MEENVKGFINGIKEKTGLEIAVFNVRGECVAGTSGADETIDTSVDGIFTDTVFGRTVFSFNYKNKKYFGRIAGASLAEQNYAKLITSLAENVFAREEELSLTEFYKALLYGELNHERIKRHVKKFSLPETSCFSMILRPKNGDATDVLAVAEGYSNNAKDFVFSVDGGLLAYVKYDDDESREYRSSTEYAEFLARFIFEESGIKVAVSVGSTVGSVFDLSQSFSQAVSASAMVKSMDFKGDVHTYKEFLFIKMLEDLPKYKLNEYMDSLLDVNALNVFTDKEMVNTADEFLENSLNVSETSRKLYLHRNTLIYRLDKIEKETGLNIRKFSDAITFRIITVLVKLVK